MMMMMMMIIILIIIIMLKKYHSYSCLSSNFYLLVHFKPREKKE